MTQPPLRPIFAFATIVLLGSCNHHALVSRGIPDSAGPGDWADGSIKTDDSAAPGQDTPVGQGGSAGQDASTAQGGSLAGQAGASAGQGGSSSISTGSAAGASGADGGVACFLPTDPQATGRATKGLVARFCFDDPNAIGADCSGQTKALAASATVKAIPGAFGLGVALNGDDAYLQGIPDGSFTPGSSDWTVSSWIRPRASSEARFVTWYRCGANPVCNKPDSAYYELGILENGVVKWWARDDYGAQSEVQSTPYAVWDGCWHFVVGVLSASEDMRLFIDGIPVGHPAKTVRPMSSGGVPVPLVLGRQFVTGWADPGYYYSGDLDEVRIYSRALAADEIRAIYEGRTPP